MRKSSIDIRTSARLKGTALAVALAALSCSVGVQARGLTHPVDPDYTGRVSVTGGSAGSSWRDWMMASWMSSGLSGWRWAW